MKQFFHQWGVTILTLVILSAAVVGLYQLTKRIGQNLAPVKPRVIIFGATYCRACPTGFAIESLVADFPDAEIEHYLIDADPDGRKLANKYHITRVPTIIVCTDRQCMKFYSLAELREWLTHAA